MGGVYHPHFVRNRLPRGCSHHSQFKGIVEHELSMSFLHFYLSAPCFGIIKAHFEVHRRIVVPPFVFAIRLCYVLWCFQITAPSLLNVIGIVQLL
jgi:hypothetical protein